MSPERQRLPWQRIALWGFVLNAIWEFAQCTILYDMWEWGFWRATAWMWGAIFGDVLIVLGVVALVWLFVGEQHILQMDLRAYGALLAVGFVAAVFLEWAAQVLNLWGYSAWMPTLKVLGRTVGVSPILQVTILPALSVLLARRGVFVASEAH